MNPQGAEPAAGGIPIIAAVLVAVLIVVVALAGSVAVRRGRQRDQRQANDERDPALEDPLLASIQRARGTRPFPSPAYAARSVGATRRVEVAAPGIGSSVPRRGPAWVGRLDAHAQDGGAPPVPVGAAARPRGDRSSSPY
jgi:hypothetical protein